MSLGGLHLEVRAPSRALAPDSARTSVRAPGPCLLPRCPRARVPPAQVGAVSSALSADMSVLEMAGRHDADGRASALAELGAERTEHEACRLQLASTQAALQRARLDAAAALASEGVRLDCTLDGLDYILAC